MTDRELLELAAKAAGIELDEYTLDVWNPLLTDGDALRLAVKLKMHIDCELRCASTNERSWEDGDGVIDDAAATRLAIVRAAAEIGKEMK